MKNEINFISSYFEKKKSIRSDVLIIGTGRWAHIVITEILLNFENIKKIYIFGKKNKLLKDKFKNKYKAKLIYINSLSNIPQQIKNCIICNGNIKHLPTAIKLLNYNYNILIEKPIIFKKFSQINNLIKVAQKKKLKLYLSLPFSYAFYIKSAHLKYGMNKNIRMVNLTWSDKMSNKETNFSKRIISFQKDNFYHFYSILRLFNLNKKIKFENKNFFKKTKNFIKFSISNNMHVEFKTNQNAKKRIRLLKIKYSNKNELEIDFNIPHKPKIIFNKKPCKIYPSLSGKMLKYQLFSFFKKRNYRLHEFKYLKGLFKLLQQL